VSLLNLSRAAFRYPSTDELFRDASFSIEPGDRVAIVGPNGAGKSTFLRILAGELEPSRGEIARRKGLRVAHVSQDIAQQGDRELFDFVFEARPQLADLRRRMQSLESRLDDHAAAGGYTDLICEYESMGGYSAEAGTERILEGLNLTRQEWRLPMHRLSGGQRTRAALGRGLHTDANVLLLDEPTNHLDIVAREWLEDQLSERNQACVVVSHDRSFLRRVATCIVEIQRSMVRLFPGSYDEYRSRRALLERQAWDNYEAFERRKIAAEQASMRRARLAIQVGTAPAGARSSHDFYRRKAAKVARTARLLRERVDHQPSVDKPWQEQPIPTLDFGHVPRSGDIALAVSDLAKRYEGKTLFEGLNFTLTRGARLAVTGRNGAGKTTLLRILSGTECADAGHVQLGAHVAIGHYTQDADDLARTSTPLEICGDGTQSRTLLACLKVRPDRVNRPIEELSSGERAKVALVRLLVSGANLLLLDEPTNHLEIESQEALEQTLVQFPGTVVVISHDRSFLTGLGPGLLMLSL
jgi:ATP-binding cassette, subfamily F, member 3